MIQSYIHIEIIFADKGGKDLIARRAITAFALFFALTGSVYPGVVIHFLHNTVSFLAADMSQGQEIAVVVIQTILLIAYMAYMLYAWKREINETGSNKF